MTPVNILIREKTGKVNVSHIKHILSPNRNSMSSETVSTQLKIRLNIKIKPKICTLVLESQPEHVISAESKQKYCSTEKRLLLNANTEDFL